MMFADCPSFTTDFYRISIQSIGFDTVNRTKSKRGFFEKIDIQGFGRVEMIENKILAIPP